MELTDESLEGVRGRLTTRTLAMPSELLNKI